ncbi:MAG: GntR family transcriptional regulator [bacterium]|nr:GntR family transcriptional regulator [bacterium]
MELAVDIEKGSAVPIYAQLSEQIRLLIRRGALSPGDSMPTVRSLAVELGVNANTVARVYRDLQRAGLLRLERGVGTFVAENGGGRAVGEKDFRSIARKATELIDLGRRAGLRVGELTQLVETLWKENANVEG